jgi:predicted dithiol-disulfide oxidoreductase (DUF899 family)
MGKNTEDKNPQNETEKAEKKLRKLAEEITELRKKYIKQLSKIAQMDVKDYTLKDTAGKEVKLSEMFGDKEYLIVIHNMGRSCTYCTLWADGFSGVTYFIEKKAAFALVSPDPPAVQKEFADSRGWKFKTYSGEGSGFIKDMGFLTDTGSYWPGTSVFFKDKDGKITRVSKDFFGPGDFYSSPFHFFDLLPQEALEEEA